MRKLILIVALSSAAFAGSCDKYLKSADIALNRIINGVTAIGSSANTNANLANALMKRYEICKQLEEERKKKKR